MSKPKVVKDYEKIDESILEQIKLEYPYGFEKYLVTFKNQKGEFVSALPFETEDRYYLIRMTKAEAREIIEDDDDYTDGQLKDSVKAEYIDKYDDPDDLDIEDVPSSEDMDDEDMDD